MGIDRIHQFENLRFVDGDIQIFDHFATLQFLPEELNGRLNRLIVNLLAFGREDHNDAVLGGKLLIDFLVFLALITRGQEARNVLLIAHPRGEKGKESGQHDRQPDGQPSSLFQKVIYPQEELRHLFNKGRKNIKISTAAVRR